MSEKLGTLEYSILAILLAASFGVGLGPLVWGYFKRERILQNGVDAQARIVDVTDTGSRHNSNPIVRIRVVLEMPGSKGTPAEVTQPVSAVELVRLQPGAVVHVRYDRLDPSKIAIVRD